LQGPTESCIIFKTQNHSPIHPSTHPPTHSSIHPSIHPCSRGIQVRHMWGMTELSPLGSLGLPKYSQTVGGLSQAELRDLKTAQVGCVLVWDTVGVGMGLDGVGNTGFEGLAVADLARPLSCICQLECCSNQPFPLHTRCTSHY